MAVGRLLLVDVGDVEEGLDGESDLLLRSLVDCKPHTHSRETVRQTVRARTRAKEGREDGLWGVMRMR